MYIVWLLRVVALLTLRQPLLFRRSKARPSRQDAFADIFSTVAALFERAAQLKPEWEENWNHRREVVLPPKYHFGNDLALRAAQDMRYATHLLQRNRWKSLVMPLFESCDADAWAAFTQTSDAISSSLLAITERYVDLLFDDERDWIDSAVEQFDDATRRRAITTPNDVPEHRRIAEGTYLPIYIGIQLSDRLLERMRFEAGHTD
jgi:hypothetical protein